MRSGGAGRTWHEVAGGAVRAQGVGVATMIEALEAQPLAATAADHAFLAARVEDVVHHVRARVREACGEPLGLLLVGSLARGEGTVWRGAGGPLALSDVDLALVLPDEATRARAVAIAPSLAAGLRARLVERGAIGGLDLGVYTPERLSRQERRPGVLEARRSGRVLFGPLDLPGRFPAFDEADVPAEEALVLLENRGAELLLAFPGADVGRDAHAALGAMHAGMKAQLDGAFAFVVATGECPATLKARQAALERRTVEGRSEPIRAVLPDFLARVEFWSAMKREPDAAAIALHLGVSDAGDLEGLARRAWREAARAWVAYYRVVAARVLGASAVAGHAEPPALAALATHAAHRARPARRLRRWWETSRAFAALEAEGRARWALPNGAARVRLALQGAPEHELAACVAFLLGGWVDAGSVDWRPLVARAFPGRPPEALDWERCRNAAVRLWDSMQTGGARTAWEGA